MRDRIDRQAPEKLRSPVTEPERRESVAELVDRQPDEQHDRDDDHGRQDAVHVDVQGAPWVRGWLVS